MSRKSKNKIDPKKALQFFAEAYGLNAYEFNYYQIRLNHEDLPNTFYDWYHTTGSLVENKDGYCEKVGVFLDSEDVAVFISQKYKYEI